MVKLYNKKMELINISYFLTKLKKNGPVMVPWRYKPQVCSCALCRGIKYKNKKKLEPARFQFPRK